MRRTAILSLSATALLISVPALRAEHQMRPGEYEMTTEMKMEGIDRQIPQTTLRQCFTEQDVKDNKKIAEQGQGRNHDCETSDMKKTGNGASWSMTCKSGAKGKAEVTYAGDGYEMTMNMEMPGGPNEAMKMKMHTKARRIGDCAK